jgi:hypothetical protein
MSRNKKEANRSIFAALDEFCASRGDPILNAGSGRWIATQNADQRRFLTNAKLSAFLPFTARKGVARFDLWKETYFYTVGFEHVLPPVELSETDVHPGILTTVISELKIAPKATTAEIRDVVEAEDSTLGGYAGHGADLLGLLYPPMRIFQSRDVADDETWRMFFLLCLSESRGTETWLDNNLADTLQGVAELELIGLPYNTLCRSIFDTDPAAMFMALYRCLEAIYAFSSARTVIDTLQLSQSWDEVAAALEDALGWHPREESSLTSLFGFGTERDHAAIFEALGEVKPDPPLAAPAAKRVYKLRNDLVHFRPAQRKVDLSKVDWNRLCEATAGLVCFIYNEVFLN